MSNSCREWRGRGITMSLVRWAGLLMVLKCICWGFTNIFPTLFEWEIVEDTLLTENLGGMPFQSFGIRIQGSSDSGYHFRCSKRVVGEERERSGYRIPSRRSWWEEVNKNDVGVSQSPGVGIVHSPTSTFRFRRVMGPGKNWKTEVLWTMEWWSP